MGRERGEILLLDGGEAWANARALCRMFCSDGVSESLDGIKGFICKRVCGCCWKYSDSWQ